MGIAVLVNPRSRANRRNPGLIEDLRRALGEAGSLWAPDGLEALGDALARIAADPPSVLAVHGGDGSLHQVLSGLIPSFADRRPPPIAILPGGTMNVVASSLGLKADPVAFLSALAAAHLAGQPATTVDRACLRVGARFGFVFGNGAIASFLEEYYAQGSYGAGRALWLSARMVASASVRGPYADKLLSAFRGRVTADGQVVSQGLLTAVSAATVREVGLGFKLNHRADEDPTRFPLLLVRAGPFGVLLDAPAVFAGRGLHPRHATSVLARAATLDPDDAGRTMAYTIDGDLYQHTGSLELAVGPTLRLVRPPELLAPARGG